ncbi:hypothetical protein [Ectothiorhodospira lacustris]|uniref:hypothetical protein n=1 Tax=Ectothiorhodospira lacustris TaxID=2899127 RepID=UPI001EE7D475|nr:hypothetical protein [Ectothiorhodospira lacustris]MCG5510192.1 hypothetical protein [Ectothiorhodospira lacustris]MCG5522035.1 hypothetical protein [Ectothiorhodospira lacustris]
MNIALEEKDKARLQFLARIVEKEARHLRITDQRFFAHPFSLQRARQLENDTDQAERANAFVARFGRLQDSLGDKLIPLYLRGLGEKTGAAIDNLDKAERLGVIPSSDTWLTVRKLRNQMIHEYIEDPEILVNALETGHHFVPVLLEVTQTLLDDMLTRGWLTPKKA